MKRKLYQKVQWDPESLKLELLDWESNSDDFNCLVAHIKGRLEQDFGGVGVQMDALISEDQLRGKVLAAAKTFHERYVSLPNHIYLSVRAFLICQQRKRNPGPGSN